MAKKKYIAVRKGSPALLPSRKKMYHLGMSLTAVGFASTVLMAILSVIPTNSMVFFTFLSVFIFIGAGVFAESEKDERENTIISPLEEFAQFQISSNNINDIPKSRRTVINTVMKCDHEDSSTTDKKGNCQVCKEGFTLAVTPELREHLDEALSEAVERAESKNRKKLYRAKERELNLNNSQSQHLASLFEDNDKIASLKKSKHTIAALKEITADDVQSTVDKENGVNTIK